MSEEEIKVGAPENNANLVFGASDQPQNGDIVVGGPEKKFSAIKWAALAAGLFGAYYAATKYVPALFEDSHDYEPQQRYLLKGQAVEDFKRNAPPKVYDFILSIPGKAKVYPYSKTEDVDFAGTTLRVVESQPLVDQKEQTGWKTFYDQLAAKKVQPESCYYLNFFYRDDKAEESRMTSYEVCGTGKKKLVFSVEGFNKFTELSRDAFIKHFATHFSFESRTGRLTVLPNPPKPAP